MVIILPPLPPLINIRCIFDDITTCYLFYHESLYSASNNGSPSSVVSCVMIAHARNTLPLSKTWWRKTWDRIPQFFSRLFIVSCHTLTYLAGVAAVALVSLDPLASTGRVWPLNLHQGPCEDVNAQLVVQGLLPRILVGREGVPLCCDSLLGNPEFVSRRCRLSLCSH